MNTTKLKKIFLNPYVLFLLLIFILYFSAIFGDFLTWDDNFNITQNRTLLSKNFLEPWKAPYYGYYMPITATIWIFIYYLFNELNPVPFHLINILLHWINCCLCYTLIKILLMHILNNANDIIWLQKTKKKSSIKTIHNDNDIQNNIRYITFLSTLLFCVHPLQVEVVAWITCLRDLLSTMFSFICIIFFIKYLINTHNKKIYFIISIIGFGLGLLSKPSIVSLPLCLLLLNVFLYRTSLIKYIYNTIIFFIMSFVILIITKMQAPDQIFTHWIAPIYLRPIVFIDSLGFYIYKTIFPVHLAANYTRTSELIFQNHLYIVTNIYFILFISFTVFLYKKIGKFIWLGLGWWILGLLPVSGFIPFSYQAISNVADRYMYFPILGLCLIIALIIYKYRTIKWIQIIFFSFILLLSLRSYMRTKIWQNNYTFYSAAIEDNPTNDQGYIGMGVFYYLLHHFKTAEKYLKEAIKINNRNSVSLSILLEILLAQNKIMEAKNLLDNRMADHIFLEKNRTRTLHLSMFYNSAANVEKALNNFEKAYQYACNAYALNKEQHIIILVQNLFNILNSKNIKVYPCF